MNDLATRANEKLTGSEQREGAPPEPCGASETSGGETVRCSRCGFESVPAGRHCPKCGAFTLQNRCAVTHGLSRFRGGLSTPLDLRQRDATAAAVLADKGGPTEVSAVVRPQVLDFAQAIQLRDAAWAHLAAVGPFTRAGRKRAAVDVYLAASARAQQLAAQIGLSRLARKVPTLDEALDAE
jgi:hypothetical protein